MRTLSLTLALSACAAAFSSASGCVPAPGDSDPTPDPQTETVTDVDGNVYGTVVIGDQVWMTENLNTTSFSDGEPIPEYGIADDWYNGNELLPFFQWSNTDDLNDIHPEPLPVDYYGALYNEVVLASGRLAPPGWRIPTTQDFRDLEAFVASDGHAGSESEALKAVFSWSPDEANGTDVYGFAALPNGYVSAVGTATGTPIIGTLSTSDMNPEGDARRTVVNLMDQGPLQYAENSIFLGAGVRCIRE